LEVETSWELAYQVGLILQNHFKNVQLALEHFCLAVDIAQEKVLSVAPESLAHLFCARMKCYEQLGLN